MAGRANPLHPDGLEITAGVAARRHAPRLQVRLDVAGGETKTFGVDGTPFEFVWRNNELTDPPGKSPDGFGDEHRMQSRITELDPPHRISFTWDNTGDVSFELEARGEKVLLTVTHRRLPSRAYALRVGPGWHMHLDILVARTTGTQPEPFWDGWIRLQKEYDARLPA